MGTVPITRFLVFFSAADCLGCCATPRRIDKRAIACVLSHGLLGARLSHQNRTRLLDYGCRICLNVLFLARAEHPHFSRHLLEFDVDEERLKIADYCEGIAEDAGIRIRVTGHARSKADIELFRRAVSNLLANAVRFTPQNAEIMLSVAECDGAVCVEVVNEGVPLDAKLLERVFDRFYRANPSRTSGASASGSTGLGLAIVRTIMELHSGKVHAESEPHGTRFVLTFSLVK